MNKAFSWIYCQNLIKLFKNFTHSCNTQYSRKLCKNSSKSQKTQRTGGFNLFDPSKKLEKNAWRKPFFAMECLISRRKLSDQVSVDFGKALLLLWNGGRHIFNLKRVSQHDPSIMMIVLKHRLLHSRYRGQLHNLFEV